MKISELGEFGLIEKIRQWLGTDPRADALGIGDDCAVLPNGPPGKRIVTTDVLVEDRHFLKDHISAADLGYKSLAVNLSDIAAMGGFADYAFLSFGLPAATEVAWLDEFFKGFLKLAWQYNLRLMGGDTTRSEKLFINITLMGHVAELHLKTRHEAQVGDVICLSGTIGDSALGLRFLLENKEDEQREHFLDRHYRPVPHLKEGQWLSHFPEVHAMMDVSDGLSSDIQRIMERAKVGAEIHWESLPFSPTFHETCERQGWKAAEMALSGGEDYCLLVCLDQLHFARISQAFEEYFERSLHPVGVITPEQNGLVYTKEGKPIELPRKGFDHFLS